MNFECVICISKSSYVVEYECKHNVCISCGIRLLKLYKNTDCPLCKQNSKKFVIKNLKSNNVKELKEDNYIFQNQDCKDKVLNLLLHKCRTCQIILKDTYELRAHYREVHGSLLCFECIDNKKQFWFEHQMYNVSTLRHHKNGKLNEDGFKGHVYCPFCNIYLYDENAAKHHCNQTHVSCAVCDILGTKNKYYNGFAELEAHFKNAHYCCTYKYCVSIKAYAFPYKTELLEHLLKFHKQNTKLSDIGSNKICDIKFFDPYYLTTQNNIKSSVINNSIINLTMNNLEVAKETTEIPNYLDRAKISEIKRNQSLRKSLIKRAVTKNQDEVCDIVEKMVTKRLNIKDGCADLKLLMKDTLLLKLLKELYFEEIQKELNEYYKVLEKQILFPKFESKHVETKSPPKKQEKTVGFKIVDLKNYKKK